MSIVCAAAPAPVTSVPFSAMNSTPSVSGAGVRRASGSWSARSGRRVGGAVGTSGRSATAPPRRRASGKPLASTATADHDERDDDEEPAGAQVHAGILPATGLPRPGAGADPRATGDPEALRGPALAARRSRSRRSRRTSIGSYASASGGRRSGAAAGGSGWPRCRSARGSPGPSGSAGARPRARSPGSPARAHQARPRGADADGAVAVPTARGGSHPSRRGASTAAVPYRRCSTAGETMDCR